MIKLTPKKEDFPEVRKQAEKKINDKKQIKENCSNIIEAVLDKDPEGYDYWYIISKLFYIEERGIKISDALNKIIKIKNGRERYVLFQISNDSFKLFRLEGNKVLPNRAFDISYSRKDFLPFSYEITDKIYDNYYF